MPYGGSWVVAIAFMVPLFNAYFRNNFGVSYETPIFQSLGIGLMLNKCRDGYTSAAKVLVTLLLASAHNSDGCQGITRRPYSLAGARAVYAVSRISRQSRLQ